MSCKIYTVFVTDSWCDPVFLVRADHEQHARDLVHDVLGRAALKAKLKDGETDRALMETGRAYAEGRVLPLVLSDEKVTTFHVEHDVASMMTIDTTATVKLVMSHIAHKAGMPTSLITAVAEESKLAQAYRRHQNILEEWLTG